MQATATRFGATTAALGNFASEVNYRSLPLEVVDLVKRCILDQVGVQVALASSASPKIVFDYLNSSGSTGPCTVVGYSARWNAENAAFINAISGHAFELDDYQLRSMNHPGTIAVPAAIAVGEIHGATGKQLIEAVAAGYEVMSRIGIAVIPSLLYDRGYHPLSTLGPFGAAATAGRMLGLSADQMCNALGLAASHAGGTVEYSQSGGETQRLHAGIATAAGIRSALLARGGYTGPRNPIEGNFGFCFAHANTFDLDRTTVELGSTWMMLDNAFKLRPYHGMVHCGVDVTMEAVGDRLLRGDDIDHITVQSSKHGVRFLGAMGAEVETVVEMQFSLRMAIAHAILEGGTPEKVLRANPKDEAIRSLAWKISIVEDEECEKEYRESGPIGPRFRNKVTIVLKDGTNLYATNYAKGSAMHPLTPAELEAKFIGLASMALPQARVAELLEKLRHLERAENVGELTKLLAIA